MVSAQISQAPSPSPIAMTSGAAYMIYVSIKAGYGTISFKKNTVRGERITQIVESNGGKAKFILPIFQVTEPNGKVFSLQTAANQLSNQLDSLQASHMVCSGSGRWWFYPEKDHPAILDGIEAIKNGTFGATGNLIKPGQRQLLDKIEACYEDAERNYKTSLTNILNELGRPEDYAEYAAMFPTLQQIKDAFLVEVDGPIRVPGAAEVAKQSPEMRSWMESVHRQMQRDIPKIVSDIALECADVLTRLRDVDPSDLNEMQARMLVQGHERLNSLKSLFDSMSQGGVDHVARSLVDQVQAITPIAYPTHGEMQVALDKLQALLLKQEYVTDSTDKGGKALAVWAGIGSLEDKIKDFKKQIERLNKLEGKAHERLLAKLQKEAATYSGLLQMKAVSLLDEVGVSVPEPEAKELIDEPETVEPEAHEPEAQELIDDSEPAEEIETEIESKIESEYFDSAIDPDVALVGF